MKIPAVVKIFFFFNLFFSSLSADATSLTIGILTEYKITSLSVSPNYGEFFVFADGKRIMELTKSSTVKFSVKGDYVQISSLNKEFGSFKKVKVIGKDAPNSFSIKPIIPEKPLRIFDENLELKVEGKFFKIINRVNIDHYVAGVVEAENGIRQNFEYYKMKAIICRTYALNNLRRHETEGYQLCDQVHCQVYKGKNRLNDDIINASVATTGVVIVDNDLKLITAAFHSNCGGQTLNSEDVWLLPTTYLKSVTDTFCLRKQNALWEYKLKSDDWINYLVKYHQYKKDSLHKECVLNYFQYNKEMDFVVHDLRIPFKTLRLDFNLKSAYFSFDFQDDAIVLKGKGYGHGLGLCQEGAMRMAELGHKYNEILHYYYKDVHLVDLSTLDFFKEDN